jgi:uncharacterized protein
MSGLDPRQPLVVDTRALGRRAGGMEAFERDAVAREDIGGDVIAIPAGEPLRLTVRLEAVTEGVLVSGSVHATAVGACVRCLDPAEVELDVTFQELFAYADRAAHHHQVGDLDEDEVRVLEGDLLDLEPVLRDAVVPALPFQPLCRADCPGLCSACGARLADDPDHGHDTIDPRWAALRAMAEPDRQATRVPATPEQRN